MSIADVRANDACPVELPFLVIEVEVINQEPETVPEYGELTNSGPSTNPLLKSNCNPTGCSTAVTGVVPALSWNRVAKFDGSYHQPCSPLAKREAGENGDDVLEARGATDPSPIGNPLRTGIPK